MGSAPIDNNSSEFLFSNSMESVMEVLQRKIRALAIGAIFDSSILLSPKYDICKKVELSLLLLETQRVLVGLPCILLPSKKKNPVFSSWGQSLFHASGVICSESDL
ncbi:unnamed protein product [Mucor hiemalis]